MPYGILVEDFVPLCCYLVQGDVSRSLSTLIRATTELQARLGPGAHFGTAPDQFEAAIVELVRLGGGNGDDGEGARDRSLAALDAITVHEVIPNMMRYRCVRFDGARVRWDPFLPGQGRPERLVRLEGYFSARWPPPPQEELYRTLVRLGWAGSLVTTCLRGGGDRETHWKAYAPAMEPGDSPPGQPRPGVAIGSMGIPCSGHGTTPDEYQKIKVSVGKMNIIISDQGPEPCPPGN